MSKRLSAPLLSVASALLLALGCSGTPEEPPADAGTTTDAGTDAGTPDAGTDAGTPDAGGPNDDVEESDTPMAPEPISEPVLTGEPVPGATLAGSNGKWRGTTPVTFTYLWLRCDGDGHRCEVLEDATTARYVIAESDLGATLRLNVTATNALGSNTASTQESAVVRRPGPFATEPPEVSGTALVGQELAVSEGSWTATGTPTFTRQWQRCEESARTCTDVAGANGSRYVLAAADLAQRLRVRVSATDSKGTTTLVTTPSAPVGRAACTSRITVGPRAPTSARNVTGTMPWADEANATAVDGAAASAGPIPPGGRTETLVARGFGLALPANAQVQGVELEVVGWSANGAGLSIVEAELEADGSTFEKDPPQKSFGTSAQTLELGAADDRWGAEWTAGQLSDGDLEVRLVVGHTGEGGFDTAFVDGVKLVVHYVTLSSTGPQRASTITQVVDAERIAWTDLANAATANEDSAFVTLPPKKTAQRILATGFGFVVPEGKVPTGVRVELDESGTSPAWVVREELLQLVSNGAPIGENRGGQGWQQDRAVVARGGGTDGWGAALTRELVGAADFGVLLDAYNFGGSAEPTVRLHDLRVTVFYDAVAGTKSFAATESGSAESSRDWNNPQAALAADSNTARVQGLSGREVTAELTATGFGFEIPENAVVHGITLGLTRQDANGGGAADATVRLVGGPVRGANRASEDGGGWSGKATYGGPADLWGHPWTAAEVNAAGFGAAFAARHGSRSGNSAPSVDAFELSVTYCAP